MKFHSHLLVSLASAALLASGAAAAADNDAAAQQYNSPAAAAQQQQAQANTDVSDNELKQFANAQKEVVAVRDSYQNKAENINSAEEMQELQTSMQDDMVKAVEKSGLDVDAYNKVAQQVMQDKDLQKRLGELQ